MASEDPAGDARGYLSKHGVERLFEAMHSQLLLHQPAEPSAFLLQYLRSLKEDEEGVYDASLAASVPPPLFGEADLAAMFGMFDVNGTGAITGAQARSALMSLGAPEASLPEFGATVKLGQFTKVAADVVPDSATADGAEASAVSWGLERLDNEQEGVRCFRWRTGAEWAKGFGGVVTGQMAKRWSPTSHKPGSRPLIWSHGQGSSMATEDATRHMFLPLSAAVRKAAPMVRYDCKGHGGSDLVPASDPDDCLWEKMAADICALGDAVGASRFVACGASSGAAVSMWAALRSPERVAGVVAVIPPTAWEARQEMASWFDELASADDEATAARLEAMSPVELNLNSSPSWLWEKTGDGSFRCAAFEGLDADAAAKHAHDVHFVEQARSGRTAAVNAVAARNDLPPLAQLELIGCPVLLLAWSGDKSHPVATAEMLHGSIPDAELHVANSIDDVEGWPELIRKFHKRCK